MADSTDIKIALKTTGAAEAAADIRKVEVATDALDQSQVKITDTARTDTSVRQKQIAEFTAWQQQRMKASSEAGVSALAVSASHEIEEKSSREAASAATALAVAEEEAAKRRGIAAREASIAIEAEAKRVVAARKKEQAVANNRDKGFAGAAMRALTPQSRVLSAVTSIAGSGDQMQALGGIASSTAMVVTASVAAIGTAAVKSYKALEQTVERYDKLRAMVVENGQELSPALEAQLSVFKEMVEPVQKATSALKAWLTLDVGELTGANALEESLRRQWEMTEKLKQARIEIATKHQNAIAKEYAAEASELERQTNALERIASLRGEIHSIENQRANNQIKIAEQTGGDVDLAKANALAVELRTGLEELQGNMDSGRSQLAQAQSEYNQANEALQMAVYDGLEKLDPKAYEQLEQAAQQAEENFKSAEQTMTDQSQMFDASKAALLENVEIKLRDLDEQAEGAVNDASDKARTAIYNTIKEKYSEVTDTTAAISEKLDAERNQTLKAIQSLEPTAMKTAKVTSAVEQVKSGIDEQGNATITALSTVSAALTQNTSRINEQQQQINQIFGRLR